MPEDDDVGQMSAWYVLAAMGLTQGCPGDPRYEIFTPLFDKVTLKFDPKYAKGKSFTITARNQCAGSSLHSVGHAERQAAEPVLAE